MKSHHKNQLPTFCHCARCRGLVKQKPRTIDDHRTRYPRSSNTPGLLGETEDEDASGARGPSGGPNVADAPPHEFPSSPDPHRCTRPASRVSDPLSAGAKSGSLSPERSGPHVPIGANELEGLLDPEPFELEDEHAFDNLLDDLPGNHWHEQHHHFLGLAGQNSETGDIIDPNNVLYDENFGLPDGGDAHNDAAMPQFQFLPGEEPEPAPDDDGDDDIDPEALCAAFDEHELIRNAYIDAFVQKSLYGATQRALKHQLKAARRTIAAHPDISAENIAAMAQTIGTAERRLGVSTSALITTFTLCPNCQRRYTPEYIANTDDVTCLNEDCNGVLFTICRLASGRKQRVSNLTYPFASPIAWIRHLLSLAGMAELLQTWRTSPEDHDQMSQPIHSDEWMRNLDPDEPLADISEGWGWRSIQARLVRHYNPQTGDVGDESQLDPPVRFVNLPFGLSLSLNTDW